MEEKEVASTSNSDQGGGFKKPVFIGRIGKLPKKVKQTTSESIEEDKDKEVLSKDSERKETSKSTAAPTVLLKELSTPIPYKEPKWSGLCPEGSGYALEVLKSGMIVDKIDLTTKPFYVFGRLANCNVVMGHPTISRHHAVLQYKAFAEEGDKPCSWYLYDLGSTHGTFLNKERLKSNHYTRIRVGHQIKLGCSTRNYIMTGPDFDSEGESDLSITEMKQKYKELRQERDKQIREASELKQREKLEEEKRLEERGIDWGMGEDAEEEPDLTDNPYAATTNEELYLDDPKKTLRGYFEREGYDLSYYCEERGNGQFICRVELPMDDTRGKQVKAEVIHKGKKKEAVVACALEACRILDRAGLLRQAKHESRRRKERDWGADDYYDSDDDTFLDRTGSVERKRKKRMQKHGVGDPGDKNKNNRPLTHDDLLKKINDLELKISQEESSLDDLRAAGRCSQNKNVDNTDPLDEFMSSLGNQGQTMAHKAEISRTKMTIQKLKAELAKTQRLAEIARPANMPNLIKKDSNQSKIQLKLGNNSVLFGKRMKLKDDDKQKLQQKSLKKHVKSQMEVEFVEEMDSDNEDSEKSVERVAFENAEGTNGTKFEKEKLSETDEQSNKGENEESEMKTKVFGPARPPENYVIPENYYEQERNRDVSEIFED